VQGRKRARIAADSFGLSALKNWLKARQEQKTTGFYPHF
jgi:hypothetical protein